MNDLVAITLGYSVVFFLAVFLINWITGGFVFKYLIVKAGRGSKALVEVYGLSHTYLKVGKIDGDLLYYKNLDKRKKIILIKKGCIFRKLGVPNILVDDEKNGVIDIDFKAIEGFDAIKLDNIIVRALTMPQITDNKDKIIMLVIAIGIIGVLAFLGFKIINMEKILLNLAGRGVIN